MAVMVIGNVVADIMVWPFYEAPETGHMVRAKRIEFSSGGCAGNTANVLAMLGIETFLAGCIGDDDIGELLIRRIKASGVDTSYTTVSTNKGTSITVVLVNSEAERSFIHCPQSNTYFTEDMLDRIDLEGCSHLHIGGLNIMPSITPSGWRRILIKAQNLGMTTSIDTSYDSSGLWLKRMEGCAEHTDYLFPNEIEASMMIEADNAFEAARGLVNTGFGKVILKLGAQGCIILGEGPDIRVDAPSDIEAIDTTGAGDAFAAGFIFGIQKGLSEKSAAGMGCICGTLACGALGATEGITDQKKVERLFRKYYR